MEAVILFRLADIDQEGAIRDPRARRCDVHLWHVDTTAWHRPGLGHFTAVGGDDRLHVQRPRWNLGGNRADEGLAVVGLKHRIEATLKSNGRARTSTHTLATRALEMRGKDL